MNTYRTEFFAACPANGIRIKYALRIDSPTGLMVETILSAVQSIERGYHEAIADELLRLLGGTQILTADHHGVHIETTRTA